MLSKRAADKAFNGIAPGQAPGELGVFQKYSNISRSHWLPRRRSVQFNRHNGLAITRAERSEGTAVGATATTAASSSSVLGITLVNALPAIESKLRSGAAKSFHFCPRAFP